MPDQFIYKCYIYILYLIGNTDMATKSGVEAATGGSDAEADETKS